MTPPPAHLHGNERSKAQVFAGTSPKCDIIIWNNKFMFTVAFGADRVGRVLYNTGRSNLVVGKICHLSL